MTYSTTYSGERSSGRGVFVFIMLMVLATISVAAINILLGNHAMESHPDTAPQTMDHARNESLERQPKHKRL
jgi:hypothetical protein